MSEEPARASSDARMLARVTALLGAVVAINTLVVSCSERRQQQDVAVITRAQAGVAFWEDALVRLDVLVKERPTSEALNHRDQAKLSSTDQNWILRCTMLARRAASVELNGSYRSQKKEDLGEDLDLIGRASEFNSVPRARAIRKGAQELYGQFSTVMSDSFRVGPSCAQIYRVAQEGGDIFDSEQGDLPSPESAPQPISETPVAVRVDPAIEAAFAGNQPSILMNSRAVDPLGYHIDVFWCDRDNQPDQVRNNIAEAVAFARQMSDLADKGERLEGQRVGRIKLRRLAVATQQLGGGQLYVTSGIQIRYDAGRDDERIFAEAMKAFAKINRATASPTGQGDRSTPWYLSAFFCQHGRAQVNPSP